MVPKVLAAEVMPLPIVTREAAAPVGLPLLAEVTFALLTD
jgi:hypothetical protein